MNGHNLLKDLTIVVPIRVDSRERKENLITLLRWLSPWDCAVIVLEGDKEATFSETELQQWNAKVSYLYQQDESPVFHRTAYINRLLQMAETPLVGVWDSDVIVEEAGVAAACTAVANHFPTIAYPYDGRFILHSPATSEVFRTCMELSLFQSEQQSCLGRPSYGGAFIVHRDSYRAIGGENERFVGWGPEDAERLYRCQILGWQVYRAQQQVLHHLHHLPTKTPSDPSNEPLNTMRKELLLECSFTRHELQQHIQDTYTWKS